MAEVYKYPDETIEDATRRNRRSDIEMVSFWIKAFGGVIFVLYVLIATALLFGSPEVRHAAWNVITRPAPRIQEQFDHLSARIDAIERTLQTERR